MSDSVHIPPELIPNILARLPVDDVLRCTSVCKSWYKLITCPSFATSHLNLSNQEPSLFLRYFEHTDRIESYCLHRDNQTFDEIAKLGAPIDFGDIYMRPWKIIDSINGLVCLFDHVHGNLLLWNPSIRKSFILPRACILIDAQASDGRKIGFGFVAKSNEYKIFKFSLFRAEIYQLSTNSWHKIRLERSFGNNVNYLQTSVNGTQTRLDCILHWYVRVLGDSPDFICSFDLENEKCGTLMLPSCLRSDVYDDADVYRLDLHTYISTFEESLCAIDYGRDRVCRIWVMKEYGETDSWQKLFTINTEEHSLYSLVYFRLNGEILFEKYGPGFCKTLVAYDYKDNQVKNDGLLTQYNDLAIHAYVESLVLLKCPNEVKVGEESTNISWYDEPEFCLGFWGVAAESNDEMESGSRIR